MGNGPSLLSHVIRFKVRFTRGKYWTGRVRVIEIKLDSPGIQVGVLTCTKPGGYYPKRLHLPDAHKFTFHQLFALHCRSLGKKKNGLFDVAWSTGGALAFHRTTTARDRSIWQLSRCACTRYPLFFSSMDYRLSPLDAFTTRGTKWISRKNRDEFE